MKASSQPVTLKDELKRLAGKKRSGKAFDEISQQVAELTEHAGTAADYLTALETAREAMSELSGALDGTEDNPLTEGAHLVKDAVDAFLEALPESEESIATLIEEAESACDEYENVKDDTDYTAQDREDAWGELCDALDNIAEALP